MTVPAMDRRAQLLAARVYLIVTPETLGADAEARVAAALASGAVDLVQARTKRPGRDALDRLAAWLAPLAAAADVPWIVDDDPAAAVRLGADGAHVGEDDMAPAEARAVLGPSRLLGVSTHDADEIARAAAGPGDHAGLGPLCHEVGDLGGIAGAGDDGAGLLLEEELDDAAAEMAGGTGDEKDGLGHGGIPCDGYE